MAKATDTLTRQMRTIRPPRRAENRVRRKASTIAKKMSGTARALSSRITSRPSSPRCRLRRPSTMGPSPKTTPSTAPSTTPIRILR